MPESTSTILDSYTVVQCFEPYWGNNKFVFRKLKKYSLTWFLHRPNSLSTSKVIPSLYNGHTWELTKFEESLNSKSLKKCKKYIKCAQQLKARYSFWINQTVIPEKNGIRNCIFPLQKRNTLLRKYRKKRDIRPSCTFTALFPSPQQQALDYCCPLLDDLWSRSSLLQRRWRQYHLEPSFWPDRGCLSGCGCRCNCGCDGYGVWPCVGWDCRTPSSWGQPCCRPLSWNQNCPKSCARHP